MKMSTVRALSSSSDELMSELPIDVSLSVAANHPKNSSTESSLFPALPALSPNSMALGVHLSLLSLNDRVSDKGAAWAVGVGTTTGGDTLEGTAGEAFLWLRGGGSGWSAAGTGGVLL
jgi:hypothetical protein